MRFALAFDDSTAPCPVQGLGLHTIQERESARTRARERKRASERAREREGEGEGGREGGRAGGREGGRGSECVSMTQVCVCVSVTQRYLGQSKLRLLGLSVIEVLAPILGGACCPALRQLHRTCCGGEGGGFDRTGECEGVVRHSLTHT